MLIDKKLRFFINLWVPLAFLIYLFCRSFIKEVEPFDSLVGEIVRVWVIFVILGVYKELAIDSKLHDIDDECYELLKWIGLDNEGEGTPASYEKLKYYELENRITYKDRIKRTLSLFLGIRYIPSIHKEAGNRCSKIHALNLKIQSCKWEDFIRERYDILIKRFEINKGKSVLNFYCGLLGYRSVLNFMSLDKRYLYYNLKKLLDTLESKDIEDFINKIEHFYQKATEILFNIDIKYRDDLNSGVTERFLEIFRENEIKLSKSVSFEKIGKQGELRGWFIDDKENAKKYYVVQNFSKGSKTTLKVHKVHDDIELQLANHFQKISEFYIHFYEKLYKA